MTAGSRATAELLVGDEEAKRAAYNPLALKYESLARIEAALALMALRDSHNIGRNILA